MPTPLQVVDAFTGWGVRNRQSFDARLFVWNEGPTYNTTAYGAHIDATVFVHVAADNLGIARTAKLMLIIIDALPSVASIIATIEADGLRGTLPSPNVERGVASLFFCLTSTDAGT